MISSYEELFQLACSVNTISLSGALNSLGNIRTDDWIVENIDWLLPHIEFVEIPGHFRSVPDNRRLNRTIRFEVCGLQWIAHEYDVYYAKLKHRYDNR